MSVAKTIVHFARPRAAIVRSDPAVKLSFTPSGG
jgi:hypothetical protein